ncbi:traf2 and NCK-interacting protein kinase-like [Xenopus tropicalis]|uniref:Traf2 and NCK-interacting protein kinase-like n=2 Tax=Xenopus tropicalis TaxID=8364 RepID=A0A8J1J7Z6_XENTR|nr:traf2 and NCK-interacting protein kinase-like [Xenopus tropicalis]
MKGTLELVPGLVVVENTAVEVIDHDPAGRFKSLLPIGKGGFGQVYKGQYVGKNKDLAIKVVNVRKNKENIELEEINLLWKCRGQKNIVQLYGAMLHVTEPSLDNRLWCVMELCEGGSIRDLMSQQVARTLPEHWIQYLCRQVLMGLKYLHKNCIIHRDLKAMNIMLTAKAQVKIIDLGLAIQLSSKDARFTGTAGTRRWMAPEVLLSHRKQKVTYNTKCDIWSLGITAIEMAEGNAPYSKVPKDQVKAMIVNNDPPTLNADVWSKEFQTFIACCLNKNQFSRPTAEELLRSKFIRKQPKASLAQKEIVAHIKRMKRLKELQKDRMLGESKKEQPPNKLSNVQEEPKNQELVHLHKHSAVQENVNAMEDLNVQENQELQLNPEQKEHPIVQELQKLEENSHLKKKEEIHENTSKAAVEPRAAKATSYTGPHLGVFKASDIPRAAKSI